MYIYDVLFYSLINKIHFLHGIRAQELVDQILFFCSLLKTIALSSTFTKPPLLVLHSTSTCQAQRTLNLFQSSAMHSCLSHSCRSTCQESPSSHLPTTLRGNSRSLPCLRLMSYTNSSVTPITHRCNNHH